MNEEKVDVVYANTSACVIGYYIKKHANIPLVWHIREFGELDQNVGFVGGKKRLFQMISKSDLVIYISKAIEKYYSTGVKAKKAIVVYNDISSHYDCYSEKNWSNRPILILSCGALNPGKGHLDVIKAIGKLVVEGYDVKLYIAGKGDIYVPLYNKLIESLGLENRVNLLGQVNAGDLKSLREQCQIGVVASRMEAFGRVTIEGMLSGMAIIGANAGGTAELIEDGKTGLLFNVGNIEEIAEKICYLISNPSEAKKIAKEGYTYSMQYILGNCARIIYKEINKLVDT